MANRALTVVVQYWLVDCNTVLDRGWIAERFQLKIPVPQQKLNNHPNLAMNVELKSLGEIIKAPEQVGCNEFAEVNAEYCASRCDQFKRFQVETMLPASLESCEVVRENLHIYTINLPRVLIHLMSLFML